MSYDELKEKHSVTCLHIYNTIQLKLFSRHKEILLLNTTVIFSIMLSMQLVRSGLVKMYLHFQFQRRWYRGFFPFPDTSDSSSVQTQYNALKSDLIFLIFKSLLKMYKP